LGKRSRFWFPSANDPGTVCTVSGFISSRRSAAWDLAWIFMAVRRDGSEFVEISLSPVASADGVIVLSAIRDISDRKRIEDTTSSGEPRTRQKEKPRTPRLSNAHRAHLDSSQDAIIGKNLDGMVTHWNKGAEQMYGYAAAAIIGKPVSTLAPPERADEIPEILRKIRHGERVDYSESVRITADKRKLNVSISISPVYDAEGAIVGRVWMGAFSFWKSRSRVQPC
jgi:PAS domain S-box-containing protein